MPQAARTIATPKGEPVSRAPLRSVPAPRPRRDTAGEETQGTHLARLIQEAGLNNKKLGELSGVRRESISRVVNDHARLGPRLAERLAPPLGVTVDELVLTREPAAEHPPALEVRVQELEEDRDYLLHVIRQLLAHLDTAGVGTPHIPAAPRSTEAVVRARGLAAQDGADQVDVPAGQRRPRLRRHR